ncbi:hypothetical protein CPC08DRAFT_817876 [Agrocybe pediades]|nr:hypothetical protein CPC08DRAFT_817876 [Agrocybe pediades]
MARPWIYLNPPTTLPFVPADSPLPPHVFIIMSYARKDNHSTGHTSDLDIARLLEVFLNGSNSTIAPPPGMEVTLSTVTLADWTLHSISVHSSHESTTPITMHHHRYTILRLYRDSDPQGVLEGVQAGRRHLDLRLKFVHRPDDGIVHFKASPMQVDVFQYDRFCVAKIDFSSAESETAVETEAVKGKQTEHQASKFLSFPAQSEANFIGEPSLSLLCDRVQGKLEGITNSTRDPPSRGDHTASISTQSDDECSSDSESDEESTGIPFNLLDLSLLFSSLKQSDVLMPAARKSDDVDDQVPWEVTFSEAIMQVLEKLGYPYSRKDALYFNPQALSDSEVLLVVQQLLWSMDCAQRATSEWIEKLKGRLSQDE